MLSSLLPYRNLKQNFPLIGLLLVSLIAFGFYKKQTSSAVKPVQVKLEQAATLKNQLTDRWFNTQKQHIIQVAQDATIQQAAQVLLTTRIKIKPEYKTAYQTLVDYFKDQAVPVRSASLLSNGGIVLFSTDPSREGQYQPLQNTTTYFRAEEVDRVRPNFYASVNTGKPSITLATPLFNQNKQPIGALAIDLNLEDLDTTIRSPITTLEGDGQGYLGDTGKTYLVGRLSRFENAFIVNSTLEESNPEPISKNEGDPTPESANGAADSSSTTDPVNTAGSYIYYLSSPGIERAMQGNNVSGLYLNYLKQPVVGNYRLTNHGLVLVAEESQAEVFASARRLTQQIFSIGTALVAIATAIIVFFETPPPKEETIVELSPADPTPQDSETMTAQKTEETIDIIDANDTLIDPETAGTIAIAVLDEKPLEILDADDIPIDPETEGTIAIAFPEAPIPHQTDTSPNPTPEETIVAPSAAHQSPVAPDRDGEDITMPTTENSPKIATLDTPHSSAPRKEPGQDL